MTARKFLGIPTQLLLLTALAQAQTTVTLSTSQNPSILGAPITLVAIVTPPNATGRVTFYDGVAILGTKTISTGAATLLTNLLPSGSRKLKAYYAGDSSNAAATSNVVTQTVNAQPSSGSFAQGTSLSAFSSAVADFDGDGKADIAYGVSDFLFLSVLLGNGDGSFRLAFSESTFADAPLAAVDFNGDGKPDLLMRDVFANKLVLRLGNGDGTFQFPLNIIATSTFSVVVGDYNGDGKADLAVANSNLGVSILLGNGDGTFQPPVVYPTSFQPGLGATTVTAADFNGDGKADLATTNSSSATVSILLGNGDGTFQPPVSVTVLAPPTSLAVGDFNKDGRADLAIAHLNNPVISILLGKGDGTFQTPVINPVGLTLGSLVVGDFNGDGNADLVGGSASVSVLLGNGDGTFQLPVNTPSSRSFGLIAAEFNGDGKTDLVSAAAVLFGTSISLAATGGTPQSTPIGTAFPIQLQVTVRDGAALVSGAAVTFVAPQFGPSATLSSSVAITDASGVARVAATANLRPGSYTVTAFSQGLSASFSLANTGPPAVITALSSPQFAPVGTGFNALQVTVKDSAGNPLSGITVVFTPPASGASAVLSSFTAVTNALGVASVTATANNTPGSYTVTAAAGAVSTPFLLTNVQAGGATLSTGKPATQSSTLPGYTTAGAASAVDGNNDGNFFHGSVTHTNLETNPWWQVDLGASATVNAIVIWNRADCCSNRLNDYWVFVSDTPFGPADTPSMLQGRAGTWSNHQTAIPNPSTFIPVVTQNGQFPILGTQGRYIRVQLSGANYLSLTEVNVIGIANSAGSNLALGKTALQSSTFLGYATAAATTAVDGNQDGDFFHASVTHTDLNINPWWQVDLGASATVNSIGIWNRTDCCSNRLNDYWVFVSDTPFSAGDTPATLQTRAGTWSSHQIAAPNPSATIVAGRPGRYIRVQLSGVGYLSLAEVQVFGTPVNPSGPNLALGKPSSQSSTLSGSAGAQSAVDGSTDGNFFNNSVTHTNLDTNAWWQVDLGASSVINSIVIWNRTDCCSTRLNGYWVFVSDTPFSPFDTPSTLQNRAGVFSSYQTTAPSPSATIVAATQGRYVRIQLNGANYLSLAEVQVQ